MNHIGIALHPLWIALIALVVSMPLFLLYLHLSQTRMGRRLRRKLLHRDWKPMFFERYTPPPSGSGGEQAP